jgi:uracil-DNA glycosylase
MSSLKRKAGTQAGADAKKPKQNGSITSFFGAPKVTPSAAKGKAATAAAAAAAEPAAPKFDKEKWVKSLTDEQRRLLQLEIETLHESWLALLKDEIVSKDFLELKKFLERETTSGKKVFPPKEDVYSWYLTLPRNPGQGIVVC